MLCKLCLQDTQLCDAHIIPDFMYRGLLNPHEKMVLFVPASKQTIRRVPTGEYDPNILCPHCDNTIIGNFETYASQVLYGGPIALQGKNFTLPDGTAYTHVKGLDYKRFKLFLLSLLWKASVSSRPFFDGVKLGPYEEIVRAMLLKGTPGPANAFPCVISSYRNSKIPHAVVTNPQKFRLENTISYGFLISGFYYVFKITEDEIVPWVLEAALSDAGDVRVLHIPERQARDLVNRYFGANIA